MDEICKCKKCGKKTKEMISSLCRVCYNKFNYQKRYYNINFEDFVKGNYIKSHSKTGNPPKMTGNEFIQKYNNDLVVNNLYAVDFCQKYNISRQTFYKLKKNNLKNLLKTIDKDKKV